MFEVMHDINLIIPCGGMGTHVTEQVEGADFLLSGLVEFLDGPQLADELVMARVLRPIRIVEITVNPRKVTTTAGRVEQPEAAYRGTVIIEVKRDEPDRQSAAGQPDGNRFADWSKAKFRLG